MNNTITVGQQLQEHGFAPEVRARSSSACGGGLGGSARHCTRLRPAAPCLLLRILPCTEGLPQCQAGIACCHAARPPLPSPANAAPSPQVPVVVVTSFPDAVKTVLDASLKSIRGYK